MSGEKRKGDRRSSILEAARKCLARYGFAKMTMDDIGREVGLNKASLYYYYRNKEAIVADVLTREAAECIQILRKKVESVQGCREKLQNYLIERFRISQQVVNLHHLSRRDFLRIRPLFQELHRQFKNDEQTFVTKIIEEGAQNGEIEQCDASRIATTIMALVEAYKTQVLENPDSAPESFVDYSSIEDDLLYAVSLIYNGLKAKNNR